MTRVPSLQFLEVQMFGLFRRRHDPCTLVDHLGPSYAEVASLVKGIDGPYPNIFECGVFVASLATAEIIYSRHPQAETLADAFNSAWIEYLAESYKVDGAPPDRRTIVRALQDHWKGYAELFRACLDAPEDKRGDAAVQLAWDVFRNCSGKAKPEREGSFVALLATSAAFLKVGILIVRWTREWLGPA
jgi:hypothetical protein